MNLLVTLSALALIPIGAMTSAIAAEDVNPSLDAKRASDIGVNRPDTLPSPRAARLRKARPAPETNIPGTTDLPNVPGVSNPPGASNTTPGTPGNTFGTGGKPLRTAE